jgi:hypothetical protein
MVYGFISKKIKEGAPLVGNAVSSISKDTSPLLYTIIQQKSIDVNKRLFLNLILFVTFVLKILLQTIK